MSNSPSIPDEYLVKSTLPSGATVTTRHYSPTMVAIELASRQRQAHTDMRHELPTTGETVYAAVTSDAATRPRRRTTMQHRPQAALTEAKRPTRLTAQVAA